MKAGKKPFYKKWWVWVIAVLVIGGIINGATDPYDGDERQAEVEKEEAQEAEVEANDDGNNNSEDEEQEQEEPEQYLSDDEVDSIESAVKEQIKSDQELGDVYELDKFEVEDDTVKLTIDLQQDPLPAKQEVIDYAEGMAWYTGEATTDEDIKVMVTSITKFEEDEIILYGFADYSNGDTTFKEKEGLQILE